MSKLKPRRQKAKAAADKAKAKARELQAVAALPEAEQEARIQVVARRLDEDPAELIEELAATSTPSREGVEPWPDTVETAVILSELVKQAQRFIVISDDAAIATALWAMFAWVHGVATHSPILAITSADIDSGKSTLLHVLKQLIPRPRLTSDLTAAGAYRIVDSEHPTMLLEEAETVFRRKPDLADIVNSSWIRGAKIPRQVHGETHWFDPYCAKVVAGNRLNPPTVPAATVSRFIKIKLWPKKPDESRRGVFRITDLPELAELSRKLARWSIDNAATLAAGEAGYV